jgi:hypothetical protein
MKRMSGLSQILKKVCLEFALGIASLINLPFRLINKNPLANWKAKGIFTVFLLNAQNFKD